MPQHLRPVIPHVYHIPYSYDDTFSSLVERCLVHFGLVKLSDLSELSSKNCGHYKSSIAKLYDYNHIQITMI